MQVIRWRGNDNKSPYGYRKKDGGIGDSGRMKVQQDFLKAVIKQMMTPANVLNIGKISKVFQESVETDLSFQNILWFGKQAFSGGLSMESVNFVTMPWKGVSAYSRSYSKQLRRDFYISYVVPDSKQLLEIVNTQISPFQEVFTRSDLDIMYVNKDGSIGSTSGYVEDQKAAVPPVKISKPAETVDPPETEVPEVTEPSGEVEDPGELEQPSQIPEGVIEVDPVTGEPLPLPPVPEDGDTETEEPPSEAASEPVEQPAEVEVEEPAEVETEQPAQLPEEPEDAETVNIQPQSVG
jgi:hypothetical protein